VRRLELRFGVNVGFEKTDLTASDISDQIIQVEQRSSTNKKKTKNFFENQKV
jgi:hypothetical protein